MNFQKVQSKTWLFVGNIYTHLHKIHVSLGFSRIYHVKEPQDDVYDPSATPL
ncbi:MAG: hypothetical protein L3J04_03580 [Robiginitomaculum sp.]|nr:hypothetical protein [Robiginitomaculum sp.]